jgi:hypothetical protein
MSQGITRGDAACRAFKIVRVVLCLAGAIGSAVFAQAPPSPGATQTNDPNRPRALAIVINRRGFEQQTTTIPSGFYLIGIFNRSGLSGLAVALERMQGNSVSGTAAAQLFKEFPQQHGKRFTKVVHLPPGTYRLQAPDRPAWVMAIQVQ